MYTDSYSKDNTEADIQQISHSLQSILQEAKNSYEALKSATGKEWEPMKQLAIEGFSKMRVSFDDFLHSASEEAKEYTSKLRQATEEQLDSLRGYIQENPFKSVLIAVGLGFLIGRVLK